MKKTGKKEGEKKKTYPICMEYVEKYDIAVFGLVSKEIQIHQLKQTGVKRTF
jgi:ABC-type branched-subunit amino acid transport system ATPase component